jgi:SAM-dependent methyltransferase
MEALARWAEVARGMDDADLDRFQLLNVLTYYAFPAQYIFFRECFVKRYHLGGRGLELGGATGESSGFIKLFYPETQMVTTDVAPVNVTLALQMADLLRFGTDYFVMADAERLPFRPSSFDFIFSSGMLHHLGNIERGLQQGYEVLKPGGHWYIVGEPSIAAPFRLFWNSRWGAGGRQSRATGVREKSYALQDWEVFFQRQRFRMVDLWFRRDPELAMSWPYAMYYTIIGRLPVKLLKMGIPCSVGFVLEKAR